MTKLVWKKLRVKILIENTITPYADGKIISLIMVCTGQA